jgi:hypothetical protein
MKSFLILLSISLGLNAYVSNKVYIPDENHPPPRYQVRQAEEEKPTDSKKKTEKNQYKQKKKEVEKFKREELTE